jgi:hypothetical protein
MNEIKDCFIKGVESAILFIEDNGYEGSFISTPNRIKQMIAGFHTTSNKNSPYQFDVDIYNAYGVSLEQIKIIKKNF